MKAVAMFEAKNRFSEIVAAAEHGEDITITRYGLPVARLVSIHSAVEPRPDQGQKVASAMRRLRQLGADGALGCPLPQATRDEQLTMAAQAAGVDIVKPSEVADSAGD